MARVDRRTDIRVDVYANNPRVQLDIFFVPDDSPPDWRATFNRMADLRGLPASVSEEEARTILSVYLLDSNHESVSEALDATVLLIQDVNDTLQPDLPSDADLIALLQPDVPADLRTVEMVVRLWWEKWKHNS